MESCEQKTKEELEKLVATLERKLEEVSSEFELYKSKHFRDRYSTHILGALSDMLTIIDYDATVIELISSPDTNHVEGITAQNLINAKIEDLLPESAYRSLRQNMDKVIATGRESVARHSMMFRGELRHYENQIFPLDENYLLCICRDVSNHIVVEQKNAEQQEVITRLNSLMDVILNNIPVCLFVKDAGNDFRYLYWNEAFAHFSGISAEEAVGRTDEELFPSRKDVERFRKDDLEALRLGRLEFEEEYTTPHGEIRKVMTLKMAMASGKEHPYVVGVSWDVTNQKKAEQELISARLKAEESDRLKSAFLANMSHEIRTPLNSIVGFSRLAIESKEEVAKKQYVEIVEKNSDILLNLFNDILDLSALEAGVLQFVVEPVSLVSVCEMLLWEHRSTLRKEVSLILDTVDCELMVYGDKQRISQVLDNLLSNACKFTPQGTVRFGFESKNNVIQFYVQDTGIGVSPEKASTIFRRFGKVDDFVQGTGLGLTICRLLVEKMGGRIWIRSKLGRGTTFYFTLPQQI